MKVALYHNLPSGGALRVLEAWLRLSRAGHHVELFLPETANDDFVPLSPYAKATHRFPAPAVRGKLGNFTQLSEISKMGKQIAAAIDDGDFDAVYACASQLTQAAEVLPSLKTPSLYYGPEHFRALYDKAVIRPHGKELIKQTVLAPRRRWLKRFDRRAIQSATRAMAHSKFSAGILHETYGVQADVVYLGVDSDQYQPGPAKRQPFVLSVGALAPVKGHQFVIESLGTLPAEQRPALTVIGDRGEYGEELKRLAQVAGVDLTLKHGIPFPEVVKLYGQATLLAAGQYQEPFGLITLEAMASRTPVVAVREGGLAETVTDQRTGLLTPRDPRAFGVAIKQVMDDPKLAAKLGAAGRADVEARWQWQATADKVDALLAQVATEGRR